MNWIVPFPPDASNDIFTRLVSAFVGERMGQPVVVEDRGGGVRHGPGAGGAGRQSFEKRCQGLAGFLALAGKSPGAINIGSSGLGTIPHLAIVLCGSGQAPAYAKIAATVGLPME